MSAGLSVYDVEVGDDAPLLSERMESVTSLVFAELANGASTADAAATVGAAVGLSLSEVGFCLAVGAKGVQH